MSAPKSIEFGGTDEELDRYLLEFARASGGWAGRDRKTGARVVGLGSLLALNPNALPCRIRVSREDGGKVGLSPEAVSFPWTRLKCARVAAYRVGQLADFLSARSRDAGRHVRSRPAERAVRHVRARPGRRQRVDRLDGPLRPGRARGGLRGRHAGVAPAPEPRRRRDRGPVPDDRAGGR